MKYIVIVFFSLVSFLCPNQKSVLSKEQTSGFQLFWKEFRQAVLDSDSVSLMKMTQFPLKTHGDQDEDPQIDINKNEFLKIFNLYLERETTMYEKTIVVQKNIDVIKRIIKPNEDGTANWQRVGDMDFEKINKGWRLTRIYIDTNAFKNK